MKSKSLLAVLSLVLVAVLMFAACGGQGATQGEGTADDKIYIGVLTHMTGNSQSWGAQAQRGMDLALEEINAAGGILGRQVEAKYFDLVDSTDTAVNACKLALEDGSISALFINSYSTTILAVLDYCEEAKMITIVEGSSPAIAALGYEHVWQCRTTDADVYTALCNYAVEQGYTNPGVTYHTLENGITAKDVCVEAFAAKGIEMPEDHQFGVAADEVNYTAYVAQLKASGIDCIVNVNQALGTALMAKGIQDIDWDVPVISGTAATASQCVENAGDATAGWFCVAEIMSSDSREYVQNFIKAYEAKYSAFPDNNAVYVYDQMYLFKAACESAGDVSDSEAVNTAMANIKNVDLVLGVANMHDDHTPFNTVNLAKIIEGNDVDYIGTVKFRD